MNLVQVKTNALPKTIGPFSIEYTKGDYSQIKRITLTGGGEHLEIQSEYSMSLFVPAPPVRKTLYDVNYTLAIPEITGWKAFDEKHLAENCVRDFKNNGHEAEIVERVIEEVV